METSTCAEMLAHLEKVWDEVWEGRRTYLISQMADKGCHEVIPYLEKHLKADNPELRWRAILDLKELKSTAHRKTIIDMFKTDPDEEVRKTAITSISAMFYGQADEEILQQALQAYDDPKSSVGLKLCAGGAMMHQLDSFDGPGWWNEDEEDLDHPAMIYTIAETRRILEDVD
ncbi:MAG: HEAT repeat domain-containing protein [Gammaproteobacteria bacterium]|nr:HEAT repeat domain-containing protein [Gammaproteobacteria bacterium]